MAHMDLDGTELALLGALLADKIEKLNNGISAGADLAYLVGAASKEEEAVILVRNVYERIHGKTIAALIHNDERMGLAS